MPDPVEGRDQQGDRMAQQWSMNWFAGFPLRRPSAAALISTFNNADRKEPQMSDEQPQTAVKDASEQAVGIVRSLADQNAMLTARLANQRATIENYQGRILELEQQVDPAEPSTELLKNQLERALHTQKILERDLEEYQQAYADLKEAAFGDGGPADEEGELPPRLLKFGHGHYLVYPAKVCLEDDNQDPKWGIVVDPTVPEDVEAYIKPLAGKDVDLTDGDVAITFQKPEDVTRLIHTLEDLRYRWFAGIFGVEEK